MGYEQLILIFTSIIYEALPFVVLGVVIAGLLEEFVPQQALAKIIPGNRFLAVALGGIKVGRVWRFARERLQSGRACAPGIGDKLWQSGSAVTRGGLTSPHQAASELDKVLRQLTCEPRRNFTPDSTA